VGGVLIIGGYESKYYIGQLTWVPLIFCRWWTIQVDAVGAEATLEEPVSAMLDSGTTTITGGSDSVRRLYDGSAAQYNESLQCWTSPLDSVPGLPPLTFRIGGNDFGIAAEDLVVPGSVVLSYTAAATFEVDNATWVYLGLCGGGSSPPDWILGDVFLQRYFTAYSFTSARVGLAPSNPLPHQ